MLDGYTQWWVNGDHPDDNCSIVRADNGCIFLSEGEVVRRFRHPYIRGTSSCPDCKNMMHLHGWIDQGEDGLTVCPGDYVSNSGNPEYSKESMIPYKTTVFQYDREHVCEFVFRIRMWGIDLIIDSERSDGEVELISE